MTGYIKKRFPSWWFLPIPLILITTGFLYIINAGFAFTGGTDPEYAYLFNGITLAYLHPDLNCIGHPGTPIQCLIAIVAWVVHVFRPGQTLWDDVILHPELYIKATLYTANVINAATLYALGKYVYRYTNDLVASLVLQLSPFAFLMTLEISYRLMPELIMTSIISCWLIVLVKILYETPEKHNYNKYCLIFAVLFGFSLADKLTFLPFYILPFIILPSWKLRLRYTILSIITFFLFAFPVLFNFPRFIGWVTSIFTHKGVYGSGEIGFVDWNVFLSNLNIILLSTLQILIPFVILAGLSIWVLVRKIKTGITIRISLGLLLIFMTHFFITAKHYAFYYLTPSLLMAVFAGFMVYFLFGKMFPEFRKRKVPEIILGLFAFLLIINVAPRANRQLRALNDRKEIKNAALEELKPFLSKDQKIISPYYYGCSSIEYGLLFGLFESGRHGRWITSEVKKHYPSTVMYIPWLDLFFDGVYNVKPPEFLKADIEYTLFIAEYSKERYEKVINALNADSASYCLDVKQLYFSPETAEAVFSLKIVR